MKESNWFQLIWASCAILSLSKVHHSNGDTVQGVLDIARLGSCKLRQCIAKYGNKSTTFLDRRGVEGLLRTVEMWPPCDHHSINSVHFNHRYFPWTVSCAGQTVPATQLLQPSSPGHQQPWPWPPAALDLATSKLSWSV